MYGVFGKIDLGVGSYLILIEQATLVGEILGSQVYRVEKLMYVPVHSTTKNPTEIEEQDKSFIQMIEKIQSDKAFFFSYSFDLSKNMQL